MDNDTLNNDRNNNGNSDTPETDAKISELENNWKRAVADYRNLERRCAEERDVLVKFANYVLLERFLPVLDNLNTFLKHHHDKALEMITKEMEEIFKAEGVEEIDCKGKNFDPEFMEATEVIEGEDNKVMEVVQKGYKFNEKVLRPARVKVGRKNTE